jgi:transmembrane sensor
MISRKLIARYREGIATREEEALLRNYFSRSNYRELEDFLEGEWNATSEHEVDDAEVKSRIWERLELNTYSNNRLFGKRRRGNRFAGKWYTVVSGVAAAALVLLVAGSVFWKWNQATIEGSVTYTEQVNNQSEAMKIALSDGSFIWLAAKSKIRYQAPFRGDERKVELDGEAYFEIARDTLHPFTVHTRSLVVEVLGTSFTVNSFSKRQDSEVSVRSGKVEVTVAGQESGIILLPNEKVAFSGKEELTKKLVESPVIVNSEEAENSFEFSSTPISEIFGELESAYQVSIKFDRKILQNCTLTARLKDQSLFTKLDMICASIGGSYVVNGTEIEIKAPGCSDNL